MRLPRVRGAGTDQKPAVRGPKIGMGPNNLLTQPWEQGMKYDPIFIRSEEKCERKREHELGVCCSWQ